MRITLLPALFAIAATSAAGADSAWPQVQALLNDRCVECHGAKKQKENLRLDSPEWLRKGSKNGPVVVAGKPEKSTLFTLANLPADDDDRMPPKGDALTAEQLALLKSWIEAGAPMDDVAAPKMNPSPSMKPAAVIPRAPELPAGVLEQLQNEQLSVTTFVNGWLEINAAHTAHGITEPQLQLLAKAAPAVLFLNLANSGITDRQVALLKPFVHLQRLHLEHTPISDAAIANLPTLSELTYLNLVGTNVSDAGLNELKRQTALRDVFVWQSKVTSSGAAQLAASSPALNINLGPDNLPTEALPESKKSRK